MTAAENRRHAILHVLARTETPITTSEVVETIEEWLVLGLLADDKDVLPTLGRFDRTHDSLVRLHRQDLITRAGRPARWQITDEARTLVLA